MNTARLKHNPLVIASLLVLFFPLGLYLVWTNPSWTNRRKLVWSGGLGLVLLIGLAQSETKTDSQPEDRITKIPLGTERVDVTLVTKLHPGMSESQVMNIAGQPHQVDENLTPGIQEVNIPQRRLVFWTYNPGTDSWITLCFEHGVLTGGGSGGYDIEKGLVLPDALKKALGETK